jgi:hypothetical protein
MKKAEENMMQAALQREMAREQTQRNLNSRLLHAARRREDGAVYRARGITGCEAISYCPVLTSLRDKPVFSKAPTPSHQKGIIASRENMI